MKRNYTIIPLALLLLIAMVACSNKSKGNTDSEENNLRARSAYPNSMQTALIGMSRSK